MAYLFFHHHLPVLSQHSSLKMSFQYFLSYTSSSNSSDLPSIPHQPESQNSSFDVEFVDSVSILKENRSQLKNQSWKKVAEKSDGDSTQNTEERGSTSIQPRKKVAEKSDGQSDSVTKTYFSIKLYFCKV